MKEANVCVPCRALRFAELRLDDQKSRITLARENHQVVAFHGPVVREVQNVVGRAGDEGVKVVAIQDIAHTLPFFLIEGIAHLATAFSLPSYFHETSLPLISL